MAKSIIPQSIIEERVEAQRLRRGSSLLGSLDALSTKSKRRTAFRVLRAQLASPNPLATITLCRRGLGQFGAKTWANGRPRRLSDPADKGTWIAEASLNAIIAALRDAEVSLRRVRP
jgi:hypothetical protein